MEAMQFFEYVRKLSHLHENSQQHSELSFLRKQESRVFCPLTPTLSRLGEREVIWKR